MRYARWEAKPIEQRRPRRASPFRLGWPPGWRIKATHEVDEILKDCHWLVRNMSRSSTRRKAQAATPINPYTD